MFHDNGNLYMKGAFIDGKMEGKWQVFAPEGWLESDGEYKANKQVGVWSYYNDKKQLAMKATVDAGMITGMCWVYDNGKPTGEGEMMGLVKNPKRNGKWKEYYPNGKVQYEGVFQMGKKNGAFKEYYDNGKPQAEGSYMFDKKNGKWTFYSKDGSVDEQLSGNYMNDKKMKF